MGVAAVSRTILLEQRYWISCSREVTAISETETLERALVKNHNLLHLSQYVIMSYLHNTSTTVPNPAMRYECETPIPNVKNTQSCRSGNDERRVEMS
jgi:hypothetical protein